jgi:hypothetical protein
LINFIKGLNEKPALKGVWLFLLLVAIFLPHWIASFTIIHDTIAPDLLLRTIGSRLQEAGKPIYEYKWQPGDPVTWLNPYPDERAGVNGVVSTPFFLKLLQPFAKLDYCTIRIVWTWVQEIFLFATAWFCCLVFQQRLRQFLFMALLASCFIYDRNWLLNLYNGQMYVVYAFVFALSGYLLLKSKIGTSPLLIFSLISIIRPFFLPAIGPLFKFTKQHILTVISAGIVALILVVATTSTHEWKQYNAAMKIYAKEQTGELAMDTLSPGLNSPLADACIKLSDGTFAVFGGGCLYSLQHYLYLFGISISNVQFYQGILVVLLLVLWWVAYKMNWLSDLPKQLLLSFFFYQLCELITPASRNPYNMIQWLPAVAWLIMYGNKQVILLLLIGLCLNHDLPFRFVYEREIGEMFLFFSLTLYLFKKKQRRVSVL